jgi:hypothetical protein
LNVAPALPIVSSVFSKSLVDLAKRSSFVTTNVSPSPNAAMALANCGLSLYAPLIFSL